MDSTIIAAIVGVGGSLIGGIVGGWLAIRASRVAAQQAYENSLLLHKQAQNQAIRGVLLGLRTEIDILRTIYESEMSANEVLSLKEGQAFEYHYPINQNYFTVYESNASLFGQIPDDELRSLIIEIYLRIKGLIDTHRYNNELLDNRNKLLAQVPSEGNHELLAKEKETAINDALEYGINIKINYEGLIEVLNRFEPKVESVIEQLSVNELEKNKIRGS